MQQYMSVIWTCLFNINYWQNHPRYFQWEIVHIKRYVRMNCIQVSHPISSALGENSSVKTDNHVPLVVPGVQATDHQTKALGNQKQTRSVGDRDLHVNQELPERLQQLTEGLTRGSSSSTTVVPADLDIHTTAGTLLLPRILQEFLRQTNQEDSTMQSLVFPKTRIAKCVRRTEVSRASDDRARQNQECRKILGHDNSRPRDSQWRSRNDIASQICSGRSKLSTQWIQFYPCKSKSARETQRNLRTLFRREENPRSIHMDKSLEVVKAYQELNWNHDRWTSQRSEPNGIAERAGT